MNAGIDLVLVIIVGIVTWSVASEGAWGAVASFLIVLISGLLSMNFFEPLANFLQNNVALSWHHRWDMICLVGLFAAFVTGLRMAADKLVPTFIAVHPRIFDPARWGFAALTGYVTMAFLLTALHTAPLPREFLGFRPERSNFFGIRAPDREWLGFTQYVSEKSMSKRSGGRIFDGTEVKMSGGSREILPSFAIRYATRRERLAAGSSAPSGTSKESGLQPRNTTTSPKPGKKRNSGF